MEERKTESSYPALDELNKKLTGFVDDIASQVGIGNPDKSRSIVNLAELGEIHGIDFMTKGVMRQTILKMLDERPETADWELRDGMLIVYNKTDENTIALGSKSMDDTESTEAPPDSSELSDPTVTRSDMYAYGYSWDGMIPLGKDKALELYDKGNVIYRLYENDAEGEIGSREEILEFGGLFGTEDFEWINENLPASEHEEPVQVYIHNPSKHKTIDDNTREGDGKAADENGSASGQPIAPEEPSGEWLTLPADSKTLKKVLERIGVDGSGVTFEITAIRIPEFLKSYVSKYNSLDELNMLASHLNGLEEYEFDNLKAILSSGIAKADNTADIINLLDADNFDAFDIIDAKNHEDLGRYYDDEHGEKPEGMSYAEYGSQCAKKDGGYFTDGCYVNHRNKDVSQVYDGTVPDEYRIVDSAFAGLKPRSVDRDSDALPKKKPSVLQQIFSSRKESKNESIIKKSKAPAKDTQKRKKNNEGPKL